jgi:hypothetical protein
MSELRRDVSNADIIRRSLAEMLAYPVHRLDPDFVARRMCPPLSGSVLSPIGK